MRFLFFQLFFFFLIWNLQSQTISFESNSNLVKIDTSQQGNIWQIGTPSKSVFNSAHSLPFAIITDSVYNYPVNNLSSFQVKIIPPSGGVFWWGYGTLSFWHKYEMENKKDGGYIEIQYDNDTNWTNIIFDNDPQINGTGFTYSWNFYTSTDTILGNIPAFTGSSGGWIESQFNWTWMIGVKSPYHDSLTIRFTFKSDSVQTNQEGWLIDDIFLRVDQPSIISQYPSDGNYFSLYPNPASTSITIDLQQPNTPQNTTLSLYSITGQLLLEQPITNPQTEIDISKLAKGIYIIKLNSDDKVDVGRFVKE